MWSGARALVITFDLDRDAWIAEPSRLTRSKFALARDHTGTPLLPNGAEAALAEPLARGPGFIGSPAPSVEPAGQAAFRVLHEIVSHEVPSSARLKARQQIADVQEFLRGFGAIERRQVQASEVSSKPLG